MPKLFIHLGAPKTGSSALQAMLAKNAEWLAEHNINYPEAASFDRAKQGLASTGNGAALGRMLNGAGVTDEFRALVTDNAKTGRDLLFSSETISRFNADAMRDFRQFAIDSGYELRFVFYVRAFIDHLISGYRQFVKRNGFSGHFKDVIADIGVEPQLKTLQRLARIVEPEEILARNYDVNRKRLAEDFFQDVLRVADMSGFDPIEGLTNRSLTQAETLVVRELNAVAGESISGRVLSDMLMSQPAIRGPFVLTTAEYAEMEARFADQVAETNTFLGDQPIGLKTDDILVSDTVATTLSDTEVVIIRLFGALMEKIVDSERRIRENRRANRAGRGEED